ncbi:MAG: hypothetical protein JST54_03205 [Deltaproteobacteria bacterium]|nr:hypothetical protein [Deltaproteobacteria bacterium]
MRTIALVLIGGLARTASAQSVSVGTATLSNTDCVSNNSDVVSFTLASESSASSTPTMQLFATTNSCPSPATDDTSVTLPDDAISLVSLRSITSTDTSGNTATLYARSLAKSSCSVGASYGWNVCLYEFWQTTAYTGTVTQEHATATATIAYDALAPGAPRLDAVSPGDQHLTVAFTSPGDSDIANYEVLLALKNTDDDEAISASAASDGGTYASYDCYPGAAVVELAGTVTSGRVPDDSGSLLIDGLTYVAQVRAVDSAGNVGPCSNPMDGTPQVIDDFWRLYKAAGGSGAGCGAASGDVGLPLLAAAVLALRRRRYS